MRDLFGLLGLFLIVVAWFPGVIETIRLKKPGLKIEFIVVYFLGSLCLVIYGLQLNAVPFVALNALAAMVPLVHLYYLLAEKGRQEKKK